MNNTKCIYKAEESEEQATVFEWAELNSGKYPCLRFMYHIANEGKRSARYGAQLRRMGLKKGVPDICLPCARGSYHGLYIEMKVGDNTPTQDQKDFLEFLRSQNYVAIVAHGAEEAIEIIKSYLNLKVTGNEQC